MVQYPFRHRLTDDKYLSRLLFSSFYLEMISLERSSKVFFFFLQWVRLSFRISEWPTVVDERQPSPADHHPQTCHHSSRQWKLRRRARDRGPEGGRGNWKNIHLQSPSEKRGRVPQPWVWAYLWGRHEPTGRHLYLQEEVGRVCGSGELPGRGWGKGRGRDIFLQSQNDPRRTRKTGP